MKTIKKLMLLIIISGFLILTNSSSCAKTDTGSPVSNQTWKLFISEQIDVNNVPVWVTDTAKVLVTPFVNSGSFSETSDSPGWWIHDGQGKKWYRLPVGGNIVHDSPGDRWSFVTMSGSSGSGGMQTMGSNSSGTANGNFPNATYIGNGVVTLTTQIPYNGTVSGIVPWTGKRE